MSSVCISNCINDATVPTRPVRTTYVSLYKWPESDAEFVRSVRRDGGAPAARVVDSISCRQMYLRSYTFSRDDDDDDDVTKNNKSKKVTSAASQTCLGKTVSFRRRKEEKEEEGGSDVILVERTKRRRKRGRAKRKKTRFACSAIFRLFQRLLSCAATVDVVDPM